MIHTLRGPATGQRRIAVVQIPRAQKSRLGWIRSAQWVAGPDTSSLNTWVPVSDLTTNLIANSSSVTPEEWQATILQAQNLRQQQTPGTLAYTPAPPTPSGATIEAPWQSWGTSSCNPNAGSFTSLGVPSPAAAAGAAAPAPVSSISNSESNWIFIAAIIGAAASLVYLQNNSGGRR